MNLRTGQGARPEAERARRLLEPGAAAQAGLRHRRARAEPGAQDFIKKIGFDISNGGLCSACNNVITVYGVCSFSTCTEEQITLYYTASHDMWRSGTTWTRRTGGARSR